MNHWKLGNGSPVTLQSIRTQLPSRAMIWFTFVNASGTNPPPAAVPFCVPFPSLLSAKAPEVQEAIRDATSSKPEVAARCIFFPNEQCFTPRMKMSSFLQMSSYLLIVEGSLDLSSVASNIPLKAENRTDK